MASLGTDERSATIVAAYLECALWASIDEDGEPLDARYSVDDIADGAVADMRGDVDDFLRLVEVEVLDVSALEPAQIGHDFWLTRNGAGVGFWDRGLGDLGDRLTTLAETYGESYLYVGDDGELHVTP